MRGLRGSLERFERDVREVWKGLQGGLRRSSRRFERVVEEVFGGEHLRCFGGLSRIHLCFPFVFSTGVPLDTRACSSGENFTHWFKQHTQCIGWMVTARQDVELHTEVLG
jgi:hypothetical protein